MKVCLSRSSQCPQPCAKPQTVKVNLTRRDLCPSEDTSEAKKIFQNIERCLVKTKFWGSETYERLPSVNITLMKNPEPENVFSITVESDCFPQLCRVFGNDIKLQVVLADPFEEYGEKFNLLSEEMAMKTPNQEETENDEQDSKRTRMDLFCEDKQVASSDKSHFGFNYNYNMLMIVWLIIPSWNMLSIRGNLRELAPLFEIGLEEPDVKLVTADETGFVVCHSKVLAAQGNGFEFLSEMDLNGSKWSEITEFNEEVLLAFRDYLYERELSKPFIQPQIALDLCKAGKKYGISSLVKEMTIILDETPIWNFEADEAVRLFEFSRGSQVFPNLKRKAIQIMKSKANGDLGELEESEEYKKLFENNSPSDVQLMKELMASALSLN